MDYSGMAQRLGQFRQAQVPGGGQRPMNGWGQGMIGGPRGGGMGQGILQGALGRAQGMGMPQSQPNPYAAPQGVLGGIMAAHKNRMGGGSGGMGFGG
jgi:hypothetical protein